MSSEVDNKEYVSSSRKFDPYLIVLGLLTIWGFILRIYELGYQSLWYDEGYSINAALQMLERGLPILPSGHFYSTAILNTSFIASSMGLFGSSEFAARLPAVLFGVLTIPLTFYFVKRLIDKKVALITAFLVTFFVLEIVWSRQARMYQQLQFFYLLSLFLFYEFTQKGTNRYLILTIISTICTVLSHSFGFSLVIVFFVYLLLTNITNTKKYLTKEFILNKKFIITFLCGVALLVLAEVAFGVFTSILSTRINYFPDYMLYLMHIFPIILYLALVGVIILLRKDYKTSLLLILAAIVPFYFICFHVQLLGYRYLYFILPLFFIFFALAIDYLTSMISLKRLRFILSWMPIIVILGLTVYSQSFNFVPQSIYYESMAPQPDFRHAYTFVNQNIEEGEIVIDTWPALGTYYLKSYPDYWLSFDIAGTMVDYCVGEDKSRELYTNTLCIKNLEMLKNVMEENPSGWLVIDSLAISRLPYYIIEYIEDNMTYYEQGSSRNITGEVRIYGWGQ